jgi:hypothetical protein
LPVIVRNAISDGNDPWRAVASRPSAKRVFYRRAAARQTRVWRRHRHTDSTKHRRNSRQSHRSLDRDEAASLAGHVVKRKWNLSIFGPVVCVYQPKKEICMMRIAFAVSAAAAVLMAAPLSIGVSPAQAQDLKMAQVDVQVGRDRDDDDRDRRRRRDSDVTVGIGPGGVSIGPRRNCRTVITTVERDDGRMIRRKERRCD